MAGFFTTLTLIFEFVWERSGKAVGHHAPVNIFTRDPGARRLWTGYLLQHSLIQRIAQPI